MDDEQFLNWIADRLTKQYGESENVDFVIALRGMAKKQAEYKRIANRDGDNELLGVVDQARMWYGNQ